MTAYAGTDLILEEVARALLLTLRSDLAAALAEVETEMEAKDAAFFAALGQETPTTTLPEPAEWLMGHYPDILDRPLDRFPAVAVICFDHRSAGDLSADQWETVTNGAHVEALLYHADADAVNRMTKRYAKAIHRVVVANKSLNGVVQDIYTSPEVTISNVAARRANEFDDEVVYMQAVRMEYVFQAPPQLW